MLNLTPICYSINWNYYENWDVYKKTEAKRIKIDRVIKDFVIIEKKICSKISMQCKNFHESANFKAITPIPVINGHQYHYTGL